MSFREDLENLKRWLEWRMWSMCSSDNPSAEMTQQRLAEHLNRGKSSLSNIVNRNAPLGEDILGDFVDFLGLTAEQAFARARIWSRTDEYQRWVKHLYPQPIVDLPPAPPHLLSALRRLVSEGTEIHEAVIEHARDSMRPEDPDRPKTRDRTVDDWRDQLLQMQSLWEKGDLPALSIGSRNARERTRLPRTRIRPRPKSLSRRGGSDPPKK